MKLFDEYPSLTNGTVTIHKMTEDDAEALRRLASNKNVYRFLPTFLYEQKYEDKREVIARMDAECFETREGILLGVYLNSAPDQMAGIAEIYNYEEKKSKASIGCRLDEPFWNKGIATQVVALLKEYLADRIGLKTITAHIMKENIGSAKTVQKNGFICKYPDVYGDWGWDELLCTDKYVFKKEWTAMREDAEKVPAVKVEQYVMAYSVEQDRVRAMLPEGYESLRPVMRINAEIRDEKTVYLEFNTPVEHGLRRGWLNIAFWKSSSGDDISFSKAGNAVTFAAPFLKITFEGTGIRGGCPAEKDNDGCFYIGNDTEFRPAEKIDAEKEFCDCEFSWSFHEGDARGKSQGKTIPAFGAPAEKEYEKQPLTAENAAAVPCGEVLGSYRVTFSRDRLKNTL